MVTMSAAEDETVQNHTQDVQTEETLSTRAKRGDGAAERCVDVRETSEHQDAMERVRMLGRKYSRSLAKLAE